jgi:hypothetical protein
MMRRNAKSCFPIVLLLTAIGLQQSGNGQQASKQDGFARVAEVDTNSSTMTLLTDERRSVQVSTKHATLMKAQGEKAGLTDFKAGQHVKYSWSKVGTELNDVKVTQTFCEREGPTVCETQAHKKECHHKCTDGPCACPK